MSPEFIPEVQVGVLCSVLWKPEMCGRVPAHWLTVYIGKMIPVQTIINHIGVSSHREL